MAIKKYSKIFLFMLLLTIISIVTIGIIFYYFDGKLGNGNYFLYDAGHQAIKSRNKNEIYLSDIQQVEYDDNFIIALRIPQRFYDCNNTTTILTTPKLQYLIIDKENDKIYTTYNKTLFEKMKKDLKINLVFLAYSEERAKKHINRYKRQNQNRDMNEVEYGCNEDFVYPVVSY